MNLAKEDSCTGKEVVLNSVYSLKHVFVAFAKKIFYLRLIRYQYICLHSTNAIHWKLLPPVTDEIKEKAKLIQSRFTGDPSYEFKHEIVKNAEDEDSLPSTEEVCWLTKRVQFYFAT